MKLKSILNTIKLALFVNLITFECLSGSSPESLKLVQIVQRHGDRTPTNFFANDPLKDPDNWPEGVGELTSRGKTRMYEFGVTLRTRYDSYLGDSPRNVTVKSSSSSRCLESAESFMTGLYQPKGSWIWNNDSVVAKNWQPIAINADDKLLRTSADCPKADEKWREFMTTDKEVTDYIHKNRDFMVWLSAQTGDNYVDVKPSPLRPLEFLSTTLRVEQECGYEKPGWADRQTLDTLRDLEKHAFYFDWKDPQIQRLRAGPLVEELVHNMLQRADEIKNSTTKATTKRLYVYETHDVNQVVLMQALGVYESVNRTPPTYTASLAFELHQIDDHFVVKLLYFNDISLSATSGDDYEELKLVKCNPKSDCTLEEFINSVDTHIPEDWDQECQDIGNSGNSGSSESSENSGNSGNSFINFNAFTLVCILMIKILMGTLIRI